ncbi:MAG: PAS domain-containing protein [Candidatus Baltobacteraceae bacterium]
MEAKDTPSQRSRTTLFAVLLAAAAVILVVFGLSRRRKRKAGARPESLASGVEAHGDPALGIEPGSTVVAANAAALLLLGYPREELLGRPLRDVVPPDDFPAVEANVALALQGRQVGFELALQARDGRRIEGSAQAAPFAAAGAGSGAVLSFREAALRPPEFDAETVSAAPPER